MFPALLSLVRPAPAVPVNVAVPLPVPVAVNASPQIPTISRADFWKDYEVGYRTPFMFAELAGSRLVIPEREDRVVEVRKCWEGLYGVKEVHKLFHGAPNIARFADRQLPDDKIAEILEPFERKRLRDAAIAAIRENPYSWQYWDLLEPQVEEDEAPRVCYEYFPKKVRPELHYTMAQRLYLSLSYAASIHSEYYQPKNRLSTTAQAPESPPVVTSIFDDDVSDPAGSTFGKILKHPGLGDSICLKKTPPKHIEKEFF